MATTNKKYDMYGNLGTGAGYVYDVDMSKVQGLNYDTPNIYSSDTSGNKSSYYDAGLAAMANDNTSKWYTGGGQYDASYVYDQIQTGKENWAKLDQQVKDLQGQLASGMGDAATINAKIAELEAAKNREHQVTEAWRATAGYSGGADGSEKIVFGGAGTGSMGTTREADSLHLQNLARQNGDAEGYYINYYTPEVAAVSADELAQQNPYFTALKGSAQGTGKEYDDLARELYINYTKTQDGIGEQMGMAGLGGSGLTETSRVALGNQYQENLADTEAARANAINALRTEVANYLSQGAITQEQADALFAGLSGGDYTVQGEGIPGQSGGWSSVFVPYTESGDGTNTLSDIEAATEGYRQALAAQYANGQTPVYEDTTITPTLSDAELYYLLKSTGMNDEAINAYFTPGNTMPTLQDVQAERTAPVQSTRGGGNGTYLANGASDTIANNDYVIDPTGMPVDSTSYTLGVPNADVKPAYAALNKVAVKYGYGTDKFDEVGFSREAMNLVNQGVASADDYSTWASMLGAEEVSPMVQYWGETYDRATYNRLIDAAVESGQLSKTDGEIAKKNKASVVTPTASAYEQEVYVAEPNSGSVLKQAASAPVKIGTGGTSNSTIKVDTSNAYVKLPTWAKTYDYPTFMSIAYEAINNGDLSLDQLRRWSNANGYQFTLPTANRNVISTADLMNK